MIDLLPISAVAYTLREYFLALTEAQTAGNEATLAYLLEFRVCDEGAYHCKESKVTT